MDSQQHQKKPAKQNGSMTEVAYEKLKAMILNNWLVPGQKLNNPDLVKKLKMSKTPIISALSRLEAEGYVRLKQNQGYYISDVAPSEILQAMEARVMLETANMDAVVARVTDQDIDKLEKINEAYRIKLKPYFDVESLPLNLEFHLTLP